MKFKIIESEGEKFLSVVSKYTWEGYKCSLFRLFYIIPIKVYEKIFLRKLNNSASEIIDFTELEYRHSKLRD